MRFHPGWFRQGTTSPPEECGLRRRQLMKKLADVAVAVLVQRGECAMRQDNTQRQEWTGESMF